MRIIDGSSVVCSSDLIQLQDIGPGSQQVAYAWCCSAQVTVHELLHVGAGGCCQVQNEHVGAQGSCFHLVHKPLAHQQASSMRDSHRRLLRSEEHTSELQSLMRISYAVFCLKKK